MKNIKTFNNYSINENYIMGIPELAEMASRQNFDKNDIQEMLNIKFKHLGDRGVIDLFKNMTGLDIEVVVKGKYQFKY